MPASLCFPCFAGAPGLAAGRWQQCCRWLSGAGEAQLSVNRAGACGGPLAGPEDKAAGCVRMDDGDPGGAAAHGLQAEEHRGDRGRQEAAARQCERGPGQASTSQYCSLMPALPCSGPPWSPVHRSPVIERVPSRPAGAVKGQVGTGGCTVSRRRGVTVAAHGHRVQDCHGGGGGGGGGAEKRAQGRPSRGVPPGLWAAECQGRGAPRGDRPSVRPLRVCCVAAGAGTAMAVPEGLLHACGAGPRWRSLHGGRRRSPSGGLADDPCKLILVAV